MSEVPAPYAGKDKIQFGPSSGFLSLTEMACAYFELKKECDTLRRENAALKRKQGEAREALFAAERRENDLIERMREGL